MAISIRNKVALVTGANRGIGKSIVETFLSHGASKVYLAVRDVESTRDIESQFGDSVATVKLDLTDSESIMSLADLATDVEILVNNAGVLLPAPLLSEEAERSLSVELDVNVYGLLRISNAFSGVLEKNKGTFVQMNSIVSVKNVPGISSYSASKAASYSLTQGLRREFADKGVGVLSVHPGPISTDMLSTLDIEGASARTVAEGIVEALEAGDFHLFPDEGSKAIERAYQSFSDSVVMVD